MCILQHSFDKEYAVMLEAYGGGVVNISAFLHSGGDSDEEHPWHDIRSRYVEEYRDEPFSISLRVKNSMNEAFTAVDAQFLKPLISLREIILPDTVTQLDVTPELEQIFQKNHTMIRGAFDSFAERFAHEHKLRFRPDDIDFDYEYFRPAQETTYRTLMFLRDGRVIVRISVSSPGSGCDNTFGGDFDWELPHDFYRNMSFEAFADEFPKDAAERIRAKAELREFWEKLKTHDVFWGDNR